MGSNSFKLYTGLYRSKVASRMCLAANFSVSIFRASPKYRAVCAAYIFSARSKNENAIGRDTHLHITMLNINNECYLHINSKIAI